MGGRRGVGIHLRSKLKSRKLSQTNFFTSSSPRIMCNAEEATYLSSRPEGPTAKRQPSPGGLGNYPRSSERRRRGTNL
jgi:hypothetical protein